MLRSPKSALFWGFWQPNLHESPDVIGRNSLSMRQTSAHKEPNAVSVNSEPILYKEGEQGDDCRAKAADHRGSHSYAGGATARTPEDQREAARQADDEASQRESTFHELQKEVHNKRKAGMRYESIQVSTEYNAGIAVGIRSRGMSGGVTRCLRQEAGMSDGQGSSSMAKVNRWLRTRDKHAVDSVPYSNYLGELVHKIVDDFKYLPLETIIPAGHRVD